MNEKRNTKLNFGKTFLWGASVSTHQVEGGNQNQWSLWELETAQVKVAKAPYLYGNLPIWGEVKNEALKPENYVSGIACDHFNRYNQDFDLAKQLNFNALRTGIEWSRIEPKEGEFNLSAVAHYKRYFMALKDRGIQPIITLWHWTMPEWMAQKGGFAKRANIKYFSRYVKFITEQLGAHFKYVITINEPTIYSLMSYYEHRWPPEESSRLKTLWVLLNLALAHKKSYKIIKQIKPTAKIGLAHNCAYFYAGDKSWISRLWAYFSHKFGNEFFINRVKNYQDFFGLNYYFSNRFLGTHIHNPDKKINDLGWDMQPDKIRQLVNKLYKKYNLPIIITESGVADRNDQYRKWWIAQSIKAINLAQEDGVKMIGYIHWSLLDNFEWAEGFWPRFGLIEVDYKTQQRKIRASAKWYAQLIQTFQK